MPLESFSVEFDLIPFFVKYKTESIKDKEFSIYYPNYNQINK